MELSIYRVDGLASADVWNLCAAYVDDLALGRRAKARGTTTAQLFLEAELKFDPDGIPHDRHANVIGWREDMPKHALKSLQQKIAAHMTLELRAGS